MYYARAWYRCGGSSTPSTPVEGVKMMAMPVGSWYRNPCTKYMASETIRPYPYKIHLNIRILTSGRECRGVDVRKGEEGIGVGEE